MNIRRPTADDATKFQALRRVAPFDTLVGSVLVSRERRREREELPSHLRLAE